MRQRLDVADPLLRKHLDLSDTTGLKQEVMDEFETVLHQMPYVGGEQSRMSDFFMRLLGFMAIGRVLGRKGLPAKVIGDIEVETYKAQLLLTPEAERLKAGRQFMSDGEQGPGARAGSLEPGAKVSRRLCLRFRRARTQRPL